MATKGRTPGRKDKWKSKNWYNVMAPDMFNRAKIAEALSDEPEKIIGRVAEVTAQDVTGDFSKMHIKLRFKVNDVRGMDAYTYFVGHDMTSDYVRRMTRRRKSKIDTTVDFKTRDDFIIRLKPLAISGKVVKAIISGHLAKKVAVACKTIQPLQRVEIRKSQILKEGYIPPAPEKEEEEEAEEPVGEKAEKPPVEKAVDEGEEAEEEAPSEDEPEAEEAPEETPEEVPE